MTCSDCPRPLAVNPRRKGTRCVACAARFRQVNLSADQRRAIAERCRRAWDRPGYRERMAEAASQGQRRRLADPAERERVAANCRRAQSMQGPMRDETRRKIARAKTEQFLGWCPPGYRPAYSALVKTKKLPAAEARAAIEAQVAADLKSFAADFDRLVACGRTVEASRLRERMASLRSFIDSQSGGKK